MVRKLKDSKCSGCPLVNQGTHYYPDQLIQDSSIFILADQPMTEGQLSYLGERCLSQAGLEMDQVSLGYLVKCHKSVNWPPSAILKPAIQHCTRAHLKIPSDTKIVVGLGRLSNEYLGCPGSPSSWRGFSYPVEIKNAQ